MPAEWQSVLDELERGVSVSAFLTWFKHLTLRSVDESEIVIGAPNVFIIKQLEGKYNQLIADALTSASLGGRKVRFISNDATVIREKKIATRTTSTQRDEAERSTPIEGSQRDGFSSTGLNPKYRFGNFVIGANNDVAVSAAQAVVENPGKRYNPYFIYGGPGLGKTHLIQAIGNEIKEKNPNLKVLYISIEQFYSSFVEAMRKNIKGFSEKYRKLDVLIVDDIQMIAGKEKSQEEFFNTFNVLHQHDKQIIVASDRMPRQIATMDERLASRLEMGLPIDLQFPDFETRCAILKAKAELEGRDIGNKAVEFLANSVKTNIRELEGKYNQLMAMSELRRIDPDELISDGYFADMGGSRNRPVPPKQVVEKTAKYFNVTTEELYGKSHARHICVPRQVAMFLLSEELGLSTVKIGRDIFNKDHTTIMHGINKVKGLLKQDFDLRNQVAELRGKIYAN